VFELYEDTFEFDDFILFAGLSIKADVSGAAFGLLYILYEYLGTYYELFGF
jgi:hypothetical protein